MKVYYCSSTEHQKEDEDFDKKIFNYIAFKFGKKNASDGRFKAGVENSFEKLSADISRLEKQIRACDLFIANITHGSPGIGFQISQAHYEKKQILLIEDVNIKQVRVKGMMTSGYHKEIKYKKYQNIDDCKIVIDEFVSEAKSKIDTKFILILPADIDKYLNWVGRERRMHKAQIVRKAIEKEMDKDKEWKLFIS